MKASIAQGLSQLPGPPDTLWPQGARSVSLLTHGTMELKLYAPQIHDPQQPHSRDELYIVARGHGRLDNGGMLTPFVEGDTLFVPAGRAHRFVDFSADFVCWVVFYGPEGGERESTTP